MRSTEHIKGGLTSQDDYHQDFSREEVICRIEQVTKSVVLLLENEQLPSITEERPGYSTVVKRFCANQCRCFVSIFMVLSFCHSLLKANRSTSTREVYYFYATHFRSQKECEAAILDAARLLGVPRSTLGLHASPKGWFCGCIQVIRNGNIVMDGQSLPSVHGAPITSEWLRAPSSWDYTIDCICFKDESQRHLVVNHAGDQGQMQRVQELRRAKCILVIEKEGIYNRLSEDRLFDHYPCILVTGKGFPDLATRILVHSIHRELHLPVYAITDCNPYGMMVLQTFYCGSERFGMEGGHRYSVPIKWLGLRPSHVQTLKQANLLPPEVYQELTHLDHKRLSQLLDGDHAFHSGGKNSRRLRELNIMKSNGYKVELESLIWLGLDYIAQWINNILQSHEQMPLDKLGNSNDII